jgi:hypothetical protein
MEVNDDAGILTPRGALRFFASNRASTGCTYRARRDGARKIKIKIQRQSQIKSRNEAAYRPA